MKTNRRDFLKKLGVVGAVGAAGAIPMVKVAGAVPVVKAETGKIIDPTNKQVIAIERQIRRCVRRDGGYRKNLNAEEIGYAKELLILLGRKKVAWDESIKLKGAGFVPAYYLYPEEERKRDVDV